MKSQEEIDREKAEKHAEQYLSDFHDGRRQAASNGFLAGKLDERANPVKPEPSVSDREAMEKVKLARERISYLCHRDAWKMSIPFQDTDDDMLFSWLCDEVEKARANPQTDDKRVGMLAEANRQLKEKLAAQDERVRELIDFINETSIALKLLAEDPKDGYFYDTVDVDRKTFAMCHHRDLNEMISLLRQFDQPSSGEKPFGFNPTLNTSGEKCPSCGSTEFMVARDMESTRHCIRCHKTWLPGGAG